MSDISKLRGVSAVEIGMLRTAGIATVAQLWTNIGKDLDRGISDLAKASGIAESRLTLLLQWNAECPQFGDEDRFISKHGWLVALPAALLLLGWSLVRIVHATVQKPKSTRSRGVIVIRDVKPGEVLVSADCAPSIFPVGGLYFNQTKDVVGLTVRRAVHAGTPIMFEDVMRPQVVTVAEIAAGQSLTPKAVRLQQSPFEPDAATTVSEVAQHIARYPFVKNEVVRLSFVMSTPPSMRRTHAIASRGSDRKGLHRVSHTMRTSQSD